MLKNKTEAPVSVAYNSITILVHPGEMLDVMDFDVKGSEIKSVELHVMNGHPNKFERIDRATQGLTKLEADRKIAELERSIEILQKNHDKLVSENDSLKNKIAGFDETINALEKERTELKKTVNDQKAKIKALK